MIYLYEAMVGVVLGLVLYFFQYLLDRIRARFNKPLKYLVFLLVPFLVVFNELNNALISSYQIPRLELFAVLVIMGETSLMIYLLLDRFFRELSIGNKMNAKTLSTKEWIHSTANGMFAIVLIAGVLCLVV